MALTLGIGYGFVSNRITTPGGKFWPDQASAIADIRKMFDDSPMWEEYEAAGKCVVEYELVSARVLDLQINFTSVEASNEYLTDTRLYEVKMPLLGSNYRLDWTIRNSVGEEVGGTASN